MIAKHSSSGPAVLAGFRSSLIVILALFALVSCTTTAPPPAPMPEVGWASLAVDPRLGWSGVSDGDTAARLEAARRDLVAGRHDEAVRRLEEALRRNPAYAPAAVALAGLALEAGDTPLAERHLQTASRGGAEWTALRFYRAELLAAQGREREALEAVRALAAEPGAPAAASSRAGTLTQELFDRLYREASQDPSPAAIGTLREAIRLQPDSSAARLLLVQRLVAAGSLAEARMEIDPLLRGPHSEEPPVQQALAEIEFGRKQYEAAIARYERIIQRSPSPEYAARLALIKREFAAANMPPRYHEAAASETLSRSQMAVLAYWNVSAVRFGRPSSEPPIAVDIAHLQSREEIVRALAFGLLQVDPVTRQAAPDRVMSGASAARLLFRLLLLRGVPSCASSALAGPSESGRAVNALEACGVDVAALRAAPDAPVTGRWAEQALRRVEDVISAE